MGYIAPIPQLQYKDYQERIRKGSEHKVSLPVTKVKNVMPYDQFQDILAREIKVPSATIARKRTNEEKNLDYIVPITGKGRYINEYI